MWDEDLLSADDFMGLATLKLLPQLDDEVERDQWIVLEKRKDKKDKVKGDIHIKCQYTPLNAMEPALVKEYLSLRDILVPDDDVTLALAIMSASSAKKDDTARALLTAFLSKGKAFALIEAAIKEEVAKTIQETTLFRVDNNATKLIKAMATLRGDKYLIATLQPTAARVASSTIGFEIDDKKIEGGQSLEKNLQNLKDVTEACITAIVSSVAACPPELRTVCHLLKTHVVAKFPQSAHQAVAGFIFLRFFGPALLAPSKTGLLTGDVPPDQARALLLISKVIQTMANNAQFGEKEPFMLQMNPVLASRQADLNRFLDEVSAVALPPSPFAEDDTYLARELKFLHRQCISDAAVDGLQTALKITNLREAGFSVSKFAELISRSSVVPSQTPRPAGAAATAAAQTPRAVAPAGSTSLQPVVVKFPAHPVDERWKTIKPIPPPAISGGQVLSETDEVFAVFCLGAVVPAKALPEAVRALGIPVDDKLVDGIVAKHPGGATKEQFAEIVRSLPPKGPLIAAVIGAFETFDKEDVGRVRPDEIRSDACAEPTTRHRRQPQSQGNAVVRKSVCRGDRAVAGAC
eukprot:TRINITY_DN10115_c0_g1_i2.p1 TRINITY_DN10115_c0_g1~~TRINITY_DN10115_c0_g1_i2.p1  ORF type:complete len:659 (+),score=154.91 TRINITY_DN10115_c0_g1_i2:245-1978(+)